MPAAFCLTLGGASIAVIQFKTRAQRKISKPPSDYVKLLYFDTITHSRMALEYLIGNFGAERVLLGSDYPYDMGTFECARQVKALSCGELDKVTMLNGLVQKLLAGVK